MMRQTLGIALLLFQLGMIAYARFTESRYFCWAPYDAQNVYAIQANLGGRFLPDEEISKRYRMPAQGRDMRAIQHVKNIIRQYEETYGRGDGAAVTLRYKVNNIDKEDWHWPAR